MDSKELNSWIRDMRADISSAITRMENNTLSDKDFEALGNMLLQLDHEVRNSPDYHADTGISYPAVSVALNEIYDALQNKNTQLMQVNNNIFRQLIVFGEAVMTKEDYEEMDKFQPREDGRTYIDFLPRMPHEQYLQTVEQLKSIGAKFDREAKQWYVEADWKMPEVGQEQADNTAVEEKKEEKEQEKENEVMDEKKFKAVYYDENSERKEVFSATKESAIQTVREAKPEWKDTERCYIQERSQETENYQQEGIYLVASGKDVTPVELKLPYMSRETFDAVRLEIKSLGAEFNADKKVWFVVRSAGEDKINQIRDCLQKHDEGIYLTLPETKTAEQFKSLIEQLKNDGARYNPDKKAWYITEKNDRNKFTEYLQDTEKVSIHGKLEQNKDSISKQNQASEKTIEPKNKDTHERA